MSLRLHHSALCPSDIEASLRFYRDGLGMAVVMDQEFTGDWPTLFGARSRWLRSVFLGDPAAPDAGIVELVAFEGGAGAVSPVPPVPMIGFFLLSFMVDLPVVLARLAELDVEVESRIEVHGVEMVTVHDPDGVLVELIHSPG